MLIPTSVPFHRRAMSITHEGTTTVRVEGLVRIETHDVVIEFREHTSVQHNTGKVEKTLGDVRTVRVPLDQVEWMSYRPGPLAWWPRLVLQVRSLDALAAFPYADGARCTLKIALRDRERARALAAHLVDGLTDTQLKLLERGERG